MDLTAFRTAVRLRASVPTTDGVWTDSFIDAAVNEALQEISLLQPWPWLERTESVAGDGTGVVDMSLFTDTVREVKTVFVDGNEAAKVSTLDIDGWDQVQPERTYFVFAAVGDTLEVKPAPSAENTIKVRYFAQEPILTLTTDAPIMPSFYHYGVVQKACSIGFEGLDDQSSAAMHEARARSVVKAMEATTLRKVRGPHRVRVRAGSQI